MSYGTFPNGTQLASSALSEEAFATLLQTLLLQILGIAIDPKNPNAAYSQVRVNWQRQGQPAWAITEDVCFIGCAPENEEFSRVRDERISLTANAAVLERQMSYTQVWRATLTFYGPNCFRRASFVSSSFASQDWVDYFLQYPPPPAYSQIFTITDWNRPTFAPEDRDGQWWPRADLVIKFNELVYEDTTVPAAASAGVNILVDTGLSVTVVAAV